MVYSACTVCLVVTVVAVAVVVVAEVIAVVVAFVVIAVVMRWRWVHGCVYGRYLDMGVQYVS